MKLKLGRCDQLRSARRKTPGTSSPTGTAAPSGQESEALCQAIGRVHAFLHGNDSVDGMMDMLRRYYPAPRYFIESNRRALERKGIPRLDAFYYAMIPGLARTGMSQQWGAHPRLDNLDAMSRYVRTLYLNAHVECFYAILLNRDGDLIRPVLLQRGGIDNAPFYLGRLLTLALQEGARFLTLAHNHPRGTLRPSREDLRCTLKAMHALASLGIPLLDHLIVAGQEVISIRRSGLLADILWTAACPGRSIASGWLDEKLNNS